MRGDQSTGWLQHECIHRLSYIWDLPGERWAAAAAEQTLNVCSLGHITTAHLIPPWFDWACSPVGVPSPTHAIHVRQLPTPVPRRRVPRAIMYGTLGRRPAEALPMAVAPF